MDQTADFAHLPKSSGGEILTPTQMAQADRLTIEGGISGIRLMENAGQAIKDVTLKFYPEMQRAVVLCGPGNNGGDGYVVARLFAELGIETAIFCNEIPRLSTDAAVAAARWYGPMISLGNLEIRQGDVIIDAMFGAGFRGKLEGAYAICVEKVNKSGAPVIAVDLPSGLNGLTGMADGVSIRADHTVTFFRKKPCHVLYPGRQLCGQVHVANIGISPRAIDEISINLFENNELVFSTELPKSLADTHKYKRGAVGVFSGEGNATGAARLAGRAAARAGAGAVTLLAPASALTTIASHVTSAMIHEVETISALGKVLEDSKFTAFVIGPAFGRWQLLRTFVLAILADRQPPEHGAETIRRAHGDGTRATRNPLGLVLDADVFSAFAENPEILFEHLKVTKVSAVLTPHEGEFRRLFGKLIDASLAKHEQARLAAKLTGAVIVFKGADTVIAAPDGRAVINTNGGSELATAGSGDVLAGIIGGLLAQGMPAFEAAAAGVWHHGDAGAKLGPRLIAEDLADAITINVPN
jgi:ADP-dependent NAD(P)H-hydrate dehydratase / NAD(P)H-hydrate epimerase